MAEKKTAAKQSTTKKSSGTFGGLIAQGESKVPAKKTAAKQSTTKVPARSSQGTRREAPVPVKSEVRQRIYLQVTLEGDEGDELDRFVFEHRSSRSEIIRALLELLREDNPTINKVKKML